MESMKPEIQHILSITSSSFSGIFRNSVIKSLIGLSVLIPLFGFISQDIYLGQHPVKLFLEFQFAFQRFFLLITGFSVLYILVNNEQNIGTQSAIRAAGIQPIEYLLGKMIAIFAILLGFQIYISVYGWTLGKIWTFDSEVVNNAYFKEYASVKMFFLHGWLNLISICILCSFASLLWLLTSRVILAYLGSVVFWLAGILKPIWVPFFLNQEDQLWVFKGLGWIFRAITPGFYSYDLWLMKTDFELSRPLLHVLVKTIEASLLIAIILVASWKASFIKRT